MIGRLVGVAAEITAENCIMDVGGVGYLVHCPATTLSALREGEPATLRIETHVREDMIRLYGFSTAEEREWFCLLLAHVQGVGAKIAMSLLSSVGTAGLSSCVASGDVAALCKAPGVGKKVAERIVAEMKGKAPAPAANAPSPPATAAANEAVQALCGLGYPRATAAEAVSEAARELGADAATSALIRSALRKASTLPSS